MKHRMTAGSAVIPDDAVTDAELRAAVINGNASVPPNESAEGRRRANKGGLQVGQDGGAKQVPTRGGDYELTGAQVDKLIAAFESISANVSEAIALLTEDFDAAGVAR